MTERTCFAGLAVVAAALRGHGRPRLRRRAEGDEDDGAPAYHAPEYWDGRYQVDGADKTYDWLGDYAKFREYIQRATGSQARESLNVLDLGCGNASLVEAMHDDGYRNITAVDISPTVIDAMRARNAEKRPDIRWMVGDAFELEFEDESFDIVLDKSTMDAICCDGDHLNENVWRLVGEVSRVLRTGGTYLVFSSLDEVPAQALQMPHVRFGVRETNIPFPFALLRVFEAVKARGPPLTATEKFAYLDKCRELDKALVERRRRNAEAERRLKEQAPSNFSLLD